MTFYYFVKVLNHAIYYNGSYQVICKDVKCVCVRGGEQKQRGGFIGNKYSSIILGEKKTIFVNFTNKIPTPSQILARQIYIIGSFTFLQNRFYSGTFFL